MKCIGSGCIDSSFLDLCNNWRWVVSFTPRPFYIRGISSLYPSLGMLGRPQNRSGRYSEVKILEP
jgi:hypothetical protein